MHDYWKNHSLTRWTFVGKVMSLLFNMLSSLVIAFPPRSKHLLISWLQSPSAVILKPKKIKSVTVSIVSPSICHEMMGSSFAMKWWDQMPWSSFFECWALSQISLSPLSFSSRDFLVSLCFCHKGGVICILRLLIFLPAILIPACASFRMMYSAYKLNKQGDNIPPWCTPFPILSQSIVPCPILTVL